MKLSVRRGILSQAQFGLARTRNSWVAVLTLVLFFTSAPSLECKEISKAIRFVAFSTDGEKFVSGNKDAATLWTIGTGNAYRKKLFGFTPGEYCLEPAVFSHDGRILACVDFVDFSESAGAYGETNIVFIDTSTGTSLQKIKLDHRIKCLVFSHDDKMLAAAGDAGQIEIWETSSCRSLATMTVRNFVDTLAFGSDGQALIVGVGGLGPESVVHTLSVTSGLELKRMEVPIARPILNPQGTAVVGSDKEHRIAVAATASGKILFTGDKYAPGKTLNSYEFDIGPVAFSRDGRLICCRKNNNNASLRIWNLTSGRLVNTLTDNSVFSSFAIRSHRSLATGNAAGSITFWDITNGRRILTYSFGRDLPDAPSPSNQGKVRLESNKVQDQKAKSKPKTHIQPPKPVRM